MNCPDCNQKIHWYQIAFALAPVWIRCKGCGTKLVGGALVKALTAVSICLSVVLGGAVGLSGFGLLPKGLLLLCGILAIVAPGVWLILRKGRYVAQYRA